MIVFSQELQQQLHRSKLGQICRRSSKVIQK
ncbi:hypothetical protein Patl1_18158 [Pistacia atlantica]|uniref:Uncharacterized protein n=1 Tax=Pistacia atlantica TaxID=434234 RepID=A0ACC1C123_9ROSI|nr:hypothetical protein Patl1_18158 [Pistacia atlantica]